MKKRTTDRNMPECPACNHGNKYVRWNAAEFDPFVGRYVNHFHCSGCVTAFSDRGPGREADADFPM